MEKHVFDCVLGISQGREDPEEPKDKRQKKGQNPASFFVPASQRCSLPSGDLEDTQPPPLKPTPPLSAIVPIPVSPNLLHSPLHMDKWPGLSPGQMTHNLESSDYEEDHIWLLI